MNRRLRMCTGCPFNADRIGPAIPADVMDAVQTRIEPGEQWVCHQTCDGAQVTDRSSRCAGADA
jgi:hypothetical protein